jgi:Mn-containing catalase
VFHHVKELQFDARVSAPDPRFARLLLEQSGGGNGELKDAVNGSYLSRLMKGKSEKEQMIHEGAGRGARARAGSTSRTRYAT